MIIKSDCRGDPRITSAPKREMSKRDPIIDIISIAQQARPKDMGQMEFLRPQLIALPMVVVMIPSVTFFVYATATPENYTLSLHDAVPRLLWLAVGPGAGMGGLATG